MIYGTPPRRTVESTLTPTVRVSRGSPGEYPGRVSTRTPDGGAIVVRVVGGLIIWLVPDWTLRRLAYCAEKQILRRPPSRTSLLRRVASRSTTELFARPSRQP